MNEFIKSKMTELFSFPNGEETEVEDMITYSYIGLQIMSSFIRSNEDNDNNYYNAIHREIRKIYNLFVRVEWCEHDEKRIPKDVKDRALLKNEALLDLEKKMVEFGHLINATTSNKFVNRNYITNNKKYKYKDVAFRLGMPDTINKSLSGLTFIEDVNDLYDDFVLEQGINIELFIESQKNDFYQISNPDFLILDLLKEKKYSESWIGFDDKDYDFNVGRKLINNHFVYYFYSQKKGNVYGKEIDEKSYIFIGELYKRVILYLKLKNNIPLSFRIEDYDDNYFKLQLPLGLPQYENAILYNIGFPYKFYGGNVSKVYKNLKFLIRKEFKTLVTDLLLNIYLIAK